MWEEGENRAYKNLKQAIHLMGTIDLGNWVNQREVKLNLYESAKNFSCFTLTDDVGISVNYSSKNRCSATALMM